MSRARSAMQEKKTYQERKKAKPNSKCLNVSTAGERKMISDFRYIVELLVQNQNFDMFESYLGGRPMTSWFTHVHADEAVQGSVVAII